MPASLSCQVKRSCSGRTGSSCCWRCAFDCFVCFIPDAGWLVAWCVSGEACAELRHASIPKIPFPPT